jgi:hypothetical protein
MKSTNPKKKDQPGFSDLPEKIRPEKNIEKWPIWHPANARTGPPQERVFERKILLPDGSRVTAKLTVAPTTKGNLTTRDQRVYYALNKQWRERGESTTFTPFSKQRLAKLLGMPWNQSTRESLDGSLYRLRGTFFIWEHAFEDKATGRVLSRLDTFNLLSDLKITRTSDDGKVNREVGYFRFHDAILKNLLANHTKPVFFDVVLSFRSEIAQLLYTHLDLILADKASFERRTKELFEDLGLEGSAYKNLSNRKQKLEPALKELEGKPITTGTIVKAALEPTKDGKDFKLVIRKGRAGKSIVAHSEPSSVVPLPGPEPQGEPSNEAQDLVRHFHRVFHGTEECHPSGKALDQAAGLLARCGMKKARHVIAFAHREAARTHFKVATFGGVLQYEARAIKDFEHQEYAKRQQLEQKHAEETKRAQEAAQTLAEEKAFSHFWESQTDTERGAFKAAAIEHAPSYGLGFVLRHYRRQRDSETQTGEAYLRMLLKAHFEASRSSSP